VSITNS